MNNKIQKQKKIKRIAVEFWIHCSDCDTFYHFKTVKIAIKKNGQPKNRIIKRVKNTLPFRCPACDSIRTSYPIGWIPKQKRKTKGDNLPF